MDLDRLEALAKDAPRQGPWEFEQNHRGDPHVLEPRPDGLRSMVAQNVNAGPKTAEYLAAVDPQTVLRLVARIRQLEADLGLVGDAVEEMRQYAERLKFRAQSADS